MSAIAYTYDPISFKFKGIVTMPKNPMRANEYLKPSNATTVPIPSYSNLEYPVFNIGTSTWSLIPSDYALSLEASKEEDRTILGTQKYELDINGDWVARDQADIDLEDASKQKAIDIMLLKNTMDTNIVNKALEITKASSIESATAFISAYQVRANNAASYENDGLIVLYAIDGFILYGALDTTQKIQDYYNGLLILLDKFRNTEINTYLAAKAVIEAS